MGLSQDPVADTGFRLLDYTDTKREEILINKLKILIFKKTFNYSLTLSERHISIYKTKLYKIPPVS